MPPRRSNALDTIFAPFLPEQELWINAIGKPINRFSTGSIMSSYLILYRDEEALSRDWPPGQISRGSWLFINMIDFGVLSLILDQTPYTTPCFHQYNGENATDQIQDLSHRQTHAPTNSNNSYREHDNRTDTCIKEQFQEYRAHMSPK